MTKKKRNARVFLETSGVVYTLHGERRMKAAVRDATENCRVDVSYFIRMEYLRGFISNLIELYFLIKDEESVSDALIVWTQTKVHQERKFVVVLMTISEWITTQDDWADYRKTLRRLGEFIIRMVCTFDETFSNRASDPMNCGLGRVDVPRRTFDEAILLDFYKQFTEIRERTASCDLCKFKEDQRRSLSNREIDLHSKEQRHRFKSNKGYCKQAERLERAADVAEMIPSCRWCERLGDSIIALHVPSEALLVTADRAFEVFKQILGFEVCLLPSLAQLRKQGKDGRR